MIVTAPLTASGLARRVAWDVQQHVAATGAHAIETELTRPAPRDVRFTKDAYREFLWLVNLGIGIVLGCVWIGSAQTASAYFYKVALILVLFGLIALWGVWRDNEKTRQWLAKGEPIPGLVVEQKNDAINRPAEYLVTFEFLALTGRAVVRQQVVVREKEFNAFTPGKVVTLIRHPDDADAARPYLLFANVEVA